MQVVVQEEAEQGDEQHALGGSEVAPVDPGAQHPGVQQRAAMATGCAAAPGQPVGQPRLHHDEHAGKRDQHRDHGLERAFRGESSAAAPMTAPITDALPSRTSRRRCPVSSAR